MLFMLVTVSEDVRTVLGKPQVAELRAKLRICVAYILNAVYEDGRRTGLGKPQVAELQPHAPVGEGDALEEGAVAVGQQALLVLGEDLGENGVTHVVGHHVGCFDP